MAYRRRTPAQRAKGYVCEWECGKSFRDGRDYVAHVAAKHSINGTPDMGLVPSYSPTAGQKEI